MTRFPTRRLAGVSRIAVGVDSGARRPKTARVAHKAICNQTVGAAACSPEFYPRHAELLTIDPLLDLFFAEVTGWARPPVRVSAQVLAVMAWAVEPGGGAS